MCASRTRSSARAIRSCSCTGSRTTAAAGARSPALLAERFRVVLIDNRGVGESDAPTGPYAVSQMAADVAAVLDDAGIERANLFGVSLGGYIAQEFTLTWPSASRSSSSARRRRAGRRRSRCRRGASRCSDGSRRWSARRGCGCSSRTRSASAACASCRSSSRRSTRTGSSARRGRGWQAQAYAGATYDSYDRIGAIAEPTLVSRAAATSSSIRGTRSCSAS